MRILFVDEIEHKYAIDSIEIQTVNSKEKALEIIANKGCDMVFVNVSFNHNFVFNIRKLNQCIPVFLINDKSDMVGLPEYAGVIDGYYTKPLDGFLAKILNKPVYQR